MRKKREEGLKNIRKDMKIMPFRALTQGIVSMIVTQPLGGDCCDESVDSTLHFWKL